MLESDKRLVNEEALGEESMECQQDYAMKGVKPGRGGGDGDLGDDPEVKSKGYCTSV